DIGFYTDQPADFVNKRLEDIKRKKGDYFIKNYIVYKARPTTEVEKDGLEEDGVDFDPVSDFMLSLNHFSDDFTLDEAIEFIKEEFSGVKIAALFNYETLV
ncbi:MAG: hypothetical protein OIF56_08190, partial [Cohaesibacter sp.]|nr:hypothetical protein [Cohaesibacter sp.]